MKKKEKLTKKEKSLGDPTGEVFSYFKKINVAAIKLGSTLKKGDKIRVKGHTTDFEQTVESMQIDGKDINEAGTGKEIGIKVKERVRPGDKIYKV